MSEHVHFDPSSISLFSAANAMSTADQTRNNAADERHSPASQTIAQKPCADHNHLSEQDHAEGDRREWRDRRKKQFSTYRRKNMEVVHRRNLIDRLDKLKAAQEAFFTVPQLKIVSNNQLSLFLRRLLKSPDIKQHISIELLERILSVGEKIEKPADSARILHRIEGELGQFIDRMPSIGFSENHRILDQQTYKEEEEDDDELTDEETTEFEADELFVPPDEFTVELHDLLEREVQILTADRRALNAQIEIRRLIEFAEKELSRLGQVEGSCIYEQPTHVDVDHQSHHLEPEEEPMEDSSARCRALLNGPRRSLVRHDFGRTRKEHRKSRPIISNKRCGTDEYAFTDASIHPQFSLPSAIPLDVQIMKYLHVVDFIPVEIEMRRFKIAQSVRKGPEHKMSRYTFYNLEEEFREEDDKFATTESKGIKISLPFRKMMKKRERNVNVDINVDQTDTESDPNDFDYGAGPFLPREMSKFKRRRMTYSSGTAKPPKLENRRTSHVEFGSSMFDYDAQVMDIGLPLPTIQKVENVEIVIPSFRKKLGLLPALSLSASDCERCRLNYEWGDTRRLHNELEQQEKNLRFRPPFSSIASRKPTAHPENEMAK